MNKAIFYLVIFFCYFSYHASFSKERLAFFLDNHFGNSSKPKENTSSPKNSAQNKSSKKQKEADPKNSHRSFSTAKPWAYWWWPGSGVTEKGITFNLESFAKAGFGGLHIIPIYGAKGAESLFQPYLSPGWQSKFYFTLQEAKRLGLGIDMTLGTGWPLGGPKISSNEAAKAYQILTIPLSAGSPLPNIESSLAKFPGSSLVTISVFEGQKFVKSISINEIKKYQIPELGATFYLFYQTLTGQKVKRAAPGGEGFVMDHFSMKSFAHYSNGFVPLLKNSHAPLRALYNDSYEVYGANYTPNFFKTFETLNGYDLREHLNVLAKEKADSDTENQIWADYHRTIENLLLNQFTYPFADWIKSMGFQSRDQAHGSPGNLIDIYAAVDIPETEFFGSKPFDIPGYRVDPEYDSVRFGIPDVRNLKLASSAANLTGKKLVASETATWLGNHFKVSLSQIKPVIDQVFIGGVNHVFFHGATYSPPEVPWPGWLFYASTNFNPQSHFWEALPNLNQYIESCQTMLQKYPTDSDVLMYFPMEDIWHQRNGKGKLHTLDLHANSRDWMKNTSFGHWSELLQEKGYQVDYISDLLLKSLIPNSDKTWQTPTGAKYKILLIPAADFVSLETMELLANWAKKGFPVYFLDHIPLHINTFNASENDLARWNSARQTMLLNVFSDPNDVLSKRGVSREKLSDMGLSFIRKKSENGFSYFVANLSNKFLEGEVSFAKINGNFELWDPLTGFKKIVNVSKSKSFFLRLIPGQSIIARALPKKKELILAIQNSEFVKTLVKISSPIQVDFIKGAPEIPKSIHMTELQYWTNDSKTNDFWGTGRYSFTFNLSPEQIKSCIVLHLDELKDWAKIRINGKELGYVWSIPFQISIPDGLLKAENSIEIDVTNVSANRIRKLDQDRVVWKNFYEINFVDIQYNPFDASKWAVTASGLKGDIYFTNR